MKRTKPIYYGKEVLIRQAQKHLQNKSPEETTHALQSTLNVSEFVARKIVEELIEKN